MTSFPTTTRTANIGLWVAQSAVALVFLFAAGAKFAMPIDVLAQQSHMPGLFIRFIGVAEILGALGLLLPGIFRIHTELTSLAASGLVIIMTGATIITLAMGPAAGAIVPFTVGVVAAFIARKRWQVTFRSETVPTHSLQQAA